MSYIDRINSCLRPSQSHTMTVLDLFSGAGGLALGFEAVGFKTIGFDKNSDCCITYRNNLKTDCFSGCLDTHSALPDADVIIGAPPCQPFSVAGKQGGASDSRDGFPAFIAAIQKVRPELFLFENVRGMMYRNKWYLDEIMSRLEVLGYELVCKLVNMADYGVPQNRKRVIVVGHKGGFQFPPEEVGVISSGEAIHDLIENCPNPRMLTKSMDAYIARYEKASRCAKPRDLNLKAPARCLTWRNLAAATSDMMRIKLPNGERRRLTVRESARLQSFPDWYEFHGSQSSQFKQIGNATPPLFARTLALAVKEATQKSGLEKKLSGNFLPEIFTP